MHSNTPSFPFFAETLARALTEAERKVVEKLLERLEPRFQRQVANLQVVGRCGCCQCPTVFFLKHEPKNQEQDLSTYAGKDESDGIVAAVLLQRNGLLSQLEFYSVDGHDPWQVPRAQDLEPYA